MKERKELDEYTFQDLDNYCFGSGTTYYVKHEADQVMDRLEARIKELEAKINVLEKQAEVTDRMLQDMANNRNKEFLPDSNKELGTRLGTDHLPQAGKMMWVSVKERLPKEGDEDDFGEVLVITDDGICYACEYDPKAGERHKWFNGDIYLHNVTHWMPLPVPPKEEK